MARKRIQRSRFDERQPTEVVELKRFHDYRIATENGRPIDAYWLKDLDNAQAIVCELNVYLGSQSAKRGVANVVLQYLAFVIGDSGALTERSLLSYRSYLERLPEVTANTKAQRFSRARHFTAHLISSGELPHQVLPKALKYEKAVAKAAFSSCCRYDLEDMLAGHEDRLNDIESSLKLPRAETMVYYFSALSMKVLYEAALQEVNNAREDWTFVDDLLCGATEQELAELRSTEWSDVQHRDVRTALKKVYAHFGREVPSSPHWPLGVCDFLRQKPNGWNSARVKAAFLSSTKQIGSYLTLLLADSRLTPNAASAAFYVYLDVCRPSAAVGYTDVHIGKKRGSPTSVTLKNSDPTVVSLVCLAERMKRLLPTIPSAKELCRREFVPLFIHLHKGRWKELDPSMPSYLVRGFIERTAKRNRILQPLVGRVTAENFRPTHALLRRLEGTSMKRLQSYLNHRSSATTVGYVERVETEALLNLKHQRFQAFIISEAEAAGKKRTGSGFYCSSEDDSSGCTTFHKCTDCDARRVVLQSVEVAAEWIAWEAKIQREKKRLMFEQPDRWKGFWEPKLAEYQGLIALSNDVVIKQARQHAAKLELPWLD